MTENPAPREPVTEFAPATESAREPGPDTENTAVTDTTSPTLVPIRAFRTPVRGHAFAGPPPGGEQPGPGVPAELAREPDNPADPLAVAVWASPNGGARWRIGYLDRGVAARVAPRLDAGSRVRAQLDGWSAEPEGRWRRPLLLLLPDDHVAADDAVDAAGRPSASARLERRSDGQTSRVWGRPPGVRRRRVS